MEADWEYLAQRVRDMDTLKPNPTTPLGEGFSWLLDMAELQLETTKYMLEKTRAHQH